MQTALCVNDKAKANLSAGQAAAGAGVPAENVPVAQAVAWVVVEAGNIDFLQNLPQSGPDWLVLALKL